MSTTTTAVSIDFAQFSRAVKAQFDQMSTGELFLVDLPKDEIWEAYLAAFPEGSDPIHITNTQHDCSCCREFVKNLGRVVSIQNGELVSVWDTPDVGMPYDVVARQLSELVKSRDVVSVYRTSMTQYGAEQTLQLTEGGTVINWDHFVGEISLGHRTSEPAEACSYLHTSAEVFSRGLCEIKESALDEIVDMIENNLIYRGSEFLPSVKSFRQALRAYNKLNTINEKDAFTWERCGVPYARFRNTVIGTLAQDLSSGVAVEDAVKMFESKVAPENYKRPKSLITKKMISDAMDTIRELGLESALDRRFAQISDITANNVLFVDRAVKPLMKGGIEDVLMAEASDRGNRKGKKTKIHIDDFIKGVVPTAKSIELNLDNALVNNLMSLTAPVDSECQNLFKWDNDFAWSYNNEVADSIKERVKKAGGNVKAKVRCSLSWYNTDDLDIHVIEPDDKHIYYGNKDGKLDVDMNAGSNCCREPVENVAWNRKMKEGRYRVYVNNYWKREDIDVGFEVEMEFEGDLLTFGYSQSVKNNQNVEVLTFEVAQGKIKNVKPSPQVQSGTVAQDVWGLKTGGYVKVDSILLSPNHWDDNEVGNKHHFFILDGCENPDSVRGIYNEFLNSRLDKHRKVFEILGSKTKCPPNDNQLSGVGFSSTLANTCTLCADGKLYEVSFN